MDREYAYGAVPRTTLDVTIGAADTTVVLDDATGWPTVGPFVITLERNTANEEKVLIASRSGTSLSVAVSGRGWDGTTARGHTTGSATYVEHTISAGYVDRLNEALALLTAKGSVLAHDGTDLIQRTVGSNGLPLVARSSDSTGVAYEQLAAGGLASDAVITAKILDSNVTTAKINDDAVTLAKIGFATGYLRASDSTDTTKANNDTTETTLATLSIAAADAAAGVVYEACFIGTGAGDGAATVTYRFKIDGTTVATVGSGFTTNGDWLADLRICCTGAAAQTGHVRMLANLGTHQADSFVTTVNMTGAVNVTMTVQWSGTGGAGNTVTLTHAYLKRYGTPA
jgi:hypothetical protein